MVLLPCSASMVVEDFFGQFAIQGAGGRCLFRDGPLWRALRDGGIVICDELNLVSSEVLVAVPRLLFQLP